MEKFVQGRELTVGVLGTQALPIIEIIAKGGVYDFTNKYPFLNPQAGGSAEHICPAKIDEGLTREIQEMALAATRALGLQVYSRVDLLLPADNKPTVLEINTIPGMTEASLLPEAAAAAGISYVICAVASSNCRRRGKGGWTHEDKAKRAAPAQSAGIQRSPTAPTTFAGRESALTQRVAAPEPEDHSGSVQAGSLRRYPGRALLRRPPPG